MLSLLELKSPNTRASLDLELCRRNSFLYVPCVQSAFKFIVELLVCLCVFVHMKISLVTKSRAKYNKIIKRKLLYFAALPKTNRTIFKKPEPQYIAK